MQFDEAIVDEFVAEAKEHMASIEGDLLSLEKMGTNLDPELVNKVFRAIHTVKGSAGFLGFVKLSDLAHVMETLLSLIRSGEIVPDTEVVDPLFRGVDVINSMLSNINESNNMVIEDLVRSIEALLAKEEELAISRAEPKPAPRSEVVPDGATLEQLLEEAKDSGPGKPESPVSVDTLDEEGMLSEMILREAPESCKYIYLLQYDLTELASSAGKTPTALMKELNEAGKILDTKIEFTVEDLRKGLPRKPLVCNVVYATSIEKDLIQGVTGLGGSSIKELKEIKRPSIIQDLEIEEPEPSQEAKEPLEQAPEPVAALEEQKGEKDVEKMIDEKENLSDSGYELIPGVGDKTKDDAATHIFGPGRQGKDQSETIRLNVSVIDKLMTLAGELVLVRNQQIRSVDKSDPVARAISQRLDVVTTEIQESIMSTRMQPIGNIFNRFPRVIREMNRQLGKKIEVEISGADVELDKTILESLADPLTHLIRNACDHGIETPAQRKALGKPETGHIFLHAYHEGGQINIVLKDDGRGIDLDRVRKKAIDRGLKTSDELAQMSDKEIMSLTTNAGFSTAEKITDMSGRGVGLDVVKTSVEDLGGVFEIDSAKGEGTSMQLRLPLTLAIIPCLIVQMDEHRYAVPQVNVEELVCLYDEDVDTKIELAGDREVYRLRNKLLSMVRLEHVLDDGTRNANAAGGQDGALGMDGASPGGESVGKSINFAVVKAGANQFGLIIDKIIGTEEIVVKPMHPAVKDIGCYAGATVMGDGKVALILDVQGVARTAGISTEGRVEEEKAEAVEQEQDTHAVMLFEYGKEEQFALALSLIKRIERIKMSSVEKLGEDRYITIDGVSTQLITLSKLLNVSGGVDQEEEEMFLLLPKHVSRPVGLVMSRLLDIQEAPSQLNDESYMEDGILGTAIIQDRLTLFPDVFRLVDLAENKWLLEERLRKENLAKGSQLPRVLVVENDPFMKILVRRYLQSEGYEVGMSTSAEEALKRLEDERFNALVCDTAALGAEGLDLIRLVRDNPATSGLPAVSLVSVEREEAEKAETLAAGYSKAEVKLEKDSFLLCLAELMNKDVVNKAQEEVVYE